MNLRRVQATAERIVRQLRHDPRTIGLMLVVPIVLLTILRGMFYKNTAEFNRFGPMLVALFPFTVMFLVTSIAMVRERTTGTLERLLTTPIGKLDILAGYGAAFAVLALVQVLLLCVVAVTLLGLDVTGSLSMVVVFALLDALLGMALGLFLSAFAATEFQAVQALPAFILPQLLLCGLFVPRDQMAPVLNWISYILPLSYAIDGVSRVAVSTELNRYVAVDLAVIIACIPLALVLGALTLRRRSA